MNTRMASKMVVTGTFSICALSRSTSTNTCGVAAAKVVNTLAMPGVRLASATNSWVTRASSDAGMPRVSCSRMEKPAAAPAPRTGGGMNTRVCASSICAASLPLSDWAILSTLSPRRCRSSKSSSTMNSSPALVAAEKVAALRPVKAFEFATPGSARRMSVALRTTASVRCSEAPGGSCSEMMRIARSMVGMNPVGRRWTNQMPKPSTRA
jgi:hypothetical protein